MRLLQITDALQVSQIADHTHKVSQLNSIMKIKFYDSFIFFMIFDKIQIMSFNLIIQNAKVCIWKRFLLMIVGILPSFLVTAGVFGISEYLEI